MATGICPHDLYGSLCHKCYPEFHTFMILKNGAMEEVVVGGMADEVITKLVRGGAERVYKRIYPNRKTKEQEAADVDE